jgi:hypothetical protein
MKAVIVTKTHFDFYTLIQTIPNYFIYEVQDICPRGKNYSFNNNWKLTSNRIL